MMDQNRCLLDVINDPQLLQSFLESTPTNSDVDNPATPSNSTTTTTTILAASDAVAAAGAAFIDAASSSIKQQLSSATNSAQPQLTRNQIFIHHQAIITTPTTNSIATTTTTTTIQSSSSNSSFEDKPPLLINYNDSKVTINNNSLDSHPDDVSSILSSIVDETVCELEGRQQTFIQDAQSYDYDSCGPSHPNPPSHSIITTVPSSMSPSVPDSISSPFPTTLPNTQPSSVENNSSIYNRDNPTLPSVVDPNAHSNSHNNNNNNICLDKPVTTPVSVLSTMTTKDEKPSANIQPIKKDGHIAPAKKRPPRKSSTKQPKGKNAKSSTAQTSIPSITPTTTTNIQSAPTIQQNNSQQQQVVYQNTNCIRQPTMLSSPMGQPLGQIGGQQKLYQIQTHNGPMYFAIAPGPGPGPPAISSPIQNQSVMQSQQFQSQQICFQINNSVMASRPTGPGVQSQPRLQTGYIASPGAQTNFSSPQMSGQPNAQSPVSSSPKPTQQQVRFTTSPVIQYGNQQTHSMQMSPAIATSSANNSNLQQLRPPAQYTSPGPFVIQNRAQNFATSQQVGSPRGSLVLNSSPMINQPQNTGRLTSPNLAGQPVAINNLQQGPVQSPQQQHMVISNSPQQQQIMMPRMSNQIILNRPQMMTGQQQFIQINTPNGPMLLALPQQPTQHLNNTMIDYSNTQIQPQMPQQSQTPSKLVDQTKPSTPIDSSKNSKSDFDLSDLLIEHGILPEDKSGQSQNVSDNKQSSLTSNQHQMNHQVPMMNTQQLSMSQQSSGNMSSPGMQPQQIRIAFSADGQMIVQQPMYGTIRPMLSAPMNHGMNGQTMMSTVSSPMNMIQSTPVVSSTDQRDVKPKSSKSTSAKKSRSKKTEDKFPTLKTPKRQQQQLQLQQQQQPQQPMQSVAILVPNNVFTDKSKMIGSTVDVKPSTAELGGQQVTLAKLMTPVVQTSGQSISNQNDSTRNHSIQNSNSSQETKVFTVQAASTKIEDIKFTGSSSSDKQDNQVSNNQSNLSTTSHINTGNVTTQILQKMINNSGTVESNPQISSMMPTISLTVDNLKTDPTTIRTTDGHLVGNLKVGQTTGPIILIHQSQAQQFKQQQTERRARAILANLESDRLATLDPQITQPFESIEDACKRLLKYHVFNAPTVNEEQLKLGIQTVDDVFEITAKSLISKKAALYDRFRLLILKQSMETAPTKSEQLMFEQLILADIQAEKELKLKKEREMLDKFEAHVENGYGRSRDFHKEPRSKIDPNTDFMTFGESSPKYNIQDNQNSISQSKEVNDWLMTDKWNKSYLSDNEAALAIESILEDEIS